MPVMNGLTAAKAISSNCPETKIIILTSDNSEHEILSAFSAGANGYCLKNIEDERLIAAIHSVAKGDFWIDSAIAGGILNLLPLQDKTARLVDSIENKFDLSEREKQVLTLIVEGKTNQVIASNLHLSVDTIKSHLKSIMDKLSVNDRTQAAVKAVREGLI